MHQPPAPKPVNDAADIGLNHPGSNRAAHLYLRRSASLGYDARTVSATHFLLWQTRNRVPARIGQLAKHRILLTL